MAPTSISGGAGASVGVFSCGIPLLNSNYATIESSPDSLLRSNMTPQTAARSLHVMPLSRPPAAPAGGTAARQGVAKGHQESGEAVKRAIVEPPHLPAPLTAE